MTLDPERRAALLGAKLGALVRAGWGDAERSPAVFGGGAALVHDDTAWVLADDEPHRVLGPTLAWAAGRDLAHVNVLVDDDAAGVVARRAVAFERAPRVWRVDGRTVAPAEPAPYPASAPLPDDAERFAALLGDRGVEVVVEHGELVGEVLGLEIARVVVGEGGERRLEVGVGRHDREAFAMLHGDVPTPEALAAVVEAVVTHRRPGASPHPLNRLAAERWLRALLLDHPGVVGARTLTPAEPPVARSNVKDATPAPAVGEGADGEAVVVVCSTGIDLDLVPAAADARGWHAPGARLVLVVPGRDDHPVTRRLADALAEPAEVVAVADDWRAGLVPLA